MLLCSEEEEPAVSLLRAKFDFTARNDRELAVSEGEELQVNQTQTRIYLSVRKER